MNLTIILKNVDKNHGKLSLLENNGLDYDYVKVVDDLSKNNTFSDRNIPGIIITSVKIRFSCCDRAINSGLPLGQFHQLGHF